MSTADTAINITELIGQAASFGRNALPVAQFIAGWFPGAAPVLQIITAALPIIDKIAAGAPAAANAIKAGRPILDAIDKSGPDVLANLKGLLALAINADPARSETAMTAADISDEEAAAFGGIVFTPGRTNAEQQREWDRAQGGNKGDSA